MIDLCTAGVCAINIVSRWRSKKSELTCANAAAEKKHHVDSWQDTILDFYLVQSNRVEDGKTPALINGIKAQPIGIEK